MNLKRIFPVFAIAIGLVLAVATSGFKDKPTNKDLSTYYFVYHPERGPASDPDNWDFTSDNSLCEGDGQSCKIRLTEDHVNTMTSPVTIDASSEPGGNLPTVSGSGSNLVPDPSSSFYDLISDKDPE